MPHRMFKYRLYPSKTQTKTLEEQLELCRIACNQLLDYCKQKYRETGRNPSQFELNKRLLAVKQLKPELSTIHSQVLQNISKRIKDAYINFHSRKKSWAEGGSPPLQEVWPIQEPHISTVRLQDRGQLSQPQQDREDSNQAAQSNQGNRENPNRQAYALWEVVRHLLMRR